MKSEIGTTLVCFALQQEAGSFRKLVASRAAVAILITGIGRKNAEDSVRDFLQKNSARQVFTCGFAGGVNPDLKIGEVIFQTSDGKLANALTAQQARAVSFHCTRRIATTVAEKAKLRRQTGADAVEMESEVIQSVCVERQIPCATVRVISDTAHEDLPLDFNQLSNPDQSLNFSKLAWAITKSPTKIPALLRLGKNTRHAAQRLAEILSNVV